MNLSRRFAAKSLTALAAAACTMGFATIAQAQATIKVGVLHALPGTMAISEAVRKDVAPIVCRRGQADRRRRHHQRRFEPALLQGTWQPGPEGDRRAGGGLPRG